MLGRWHPSPRSTQDRRCIILKAQLALPWWVRSAWRAACRHRTPFAATRLGGDVHPVADHDGAGLISRPARDLTARAFCWCLASWVHRCRRGRPWVSHVRLAACLLYTSDAADEE